MVKMATLLKVLKLRFASNSCEVWLLKEKNNKRYPMALLMLRYRFDLTWSLNQQEIKSYMCLDFKF